MNSQSNFKDKPDPGFKTRPIGPGEYYDELRRAIKLYPDVDCFNCLGKNHYSPLCPEILGRRGDQIHENVEKAKQSKPQANFARANNKPSSNPKSTKRVDQIIQHTPAQLRQMRRQQKFDKNGNKVLFVDEEESGIEEEVESEAEGDIYHMVSSDVDQGGEVEQENDDEEEEDEDADDARIQSLNHYINAINQQAKQQQKRKPQQKKKIVPGKRVNMAINNNFAWNGPQVRVEPIGTMMLDTGSVTSAIKEEDIPESAVMESIDQVLYSDINEGTIRVNRMAKIKITPTLTGFEVSDSGTEINFAVIPDLAHTFLGYPDIQNLKMVLLPGREYDSSAEHVCMWECRHRTINGVTKPYVLPILAPGPDPQHQRQVNMVKGKKSKGKGKRVRQQAERAQSDQDEAYGSQGTQPNSRSQSPEPEGNKSQTKSLVCVPKRRPDRGKSPNLRRETIALPYHGSEDGNRQVVHTI